MGGASGNLGLCPQCPTQQEMVTRLGQPLHYLVKLSLPASYVLPTLPCTEQIVYNDMKHTIAYRPCGRRERGVGGERGLGMISHMT